MNRKLGEMSFLNLRKTIGFIGFLLPTINFIIDYFYCKTFQSSISSTYYTITGDLFVLSLAAIAFFFLTDKGYDNLDNICNKLAGICCILIALCPCEQETSSCVIRYLPEIKIRIITHYTCASILFCDLSFICLFLFTKGNKNKTKRKSIRNKIYIICGIIIFLSTLSIILLLKINYSIYYSESICFFAFGFSCMVKGRTFLKDT